MASRAALVTGGSRAIGLAMARVLGEQGYGLTICSNEGAEVATVVKALRGAGLDAHGHVADVAVEQDVAEMVAAHRHLWGRLDLLANNAGVAPWSPAEETKTADLDHALAVNLRAVVLGTREALPLLRQAGREHGQALIVNTASIAGKSGPARLGVYGATKRGVIEFSRSTQLEVGADGVRCTALAPSLVDTPMTDSVKGEGGGQRMIRPEDIGEAVRFLLRLSPGCHVPELVFTGPGGPPSRHPQR